MTSAQSPKAVAVPAIAFVLATAALLAPEGLVATAPTSRACSAPAYRAFDFWIGDWNVSDFPGADNVAHVRVERALGGCVLHEFYEDGTGGKGESFSIYDASRGVWHQTWVTNHGTLLTIEGNPHHGEMLLSGVQRVEGGGRKQVRGVWRPVTGGVRETAVTSLDGGKTWKAWFDLLFRRRV